MNVSPRGLRAIRHRLTSRPVSRRQRMDMVVLAHIKEQSRLSLGSYATPRMTQDLKEVAVDVGHRCVGRLMCENGIIVERTPNFKVEEGQKMIRGIIFPMTHRQQPHVQHRDEIAGPRLHR